MEGVGVDARGRLAPVPEGAVLTLHCSGVSADPLWRHAGAPQLCLCLTRLDPASDMRTRSDPPCLTSWGAPARLFITRQASFQVEVTKRCSSQTTP